MYLGSVFVNDIITEVFGLNPTSERYQNLGGVKCDRNIFYYCISRKSRYLSDVCAIALKALIMKEIKNNKFKQDNLFNYFKKYLPQDVSLYINNNPTKLAETIDLAISKFASPASNSDDTQELSSKIKIPIIVQEVSELYIKTAHYLNVDKVTAFNLLYRTLENIIGYIKLHENLNFLENSPTDERTIKTIEYKHIMPESILFTIKELSKLTSLRDSSNSYNDFLRIIYVCFSNVVKWFIKDYIKDSLQFTIIEHKADESFYYNKYNDDIKVCNIEELKNMGWSIHDIAKSISDFVDKSMNELSPEDYTGVELLIEKIEKHPESRRVLLDSNNEIVGYWNFVPLKDEYFKLDKEGNLPAKEMLPHTMPEYMIVGKRYNIHFGSTCLKNVFRKTYTFKKLLFSIIEFIEKLALDGIFIDEIITEAVSKEGEELSEHLGFHFYKNTESSAKIYYAHIIDLIDKPYLKEFELLKSLYKEEYKAYN